MMQEKLEDSETYRCDVANHGRHVAWSPCHVVGVVCREYL